MKKYKNRKDAVKISFQLILKQDFFIIIIVGKNLKSR